MTVLDPCWYKGFSLIVERRGYSLVAVFGLLIAVASLVVEHRFEDTQASVLPAHGLSSGGSRAKGHRLQLWHVSLVAPWHVGFSPIRDWTSVSFIGRQILYHQVTRKTLLFFFRWLFVDFFHADMNNYNCLKYFNSILLKNYIYIYICIYIYIYIMDNFLYLKSPFKVENRRLIKYNNNLHYKIIIRNKSISKIHK